MKEIAVVFMSDGLKNHIPADTSSVMNCHPGGATETVSDHILNRHVGTLCRSIIDIGCLTVRTVGAADIMMIATDYHWTLPT